MFLRLNVSVDAANTAISVTPALIARSGTPRNAGKHLRRIGHLRHPFRADERGHFDHRQIRGAQAIDERDLVRGRHRDVLVLQAVARPHFDNGRVMNHLQRSALAIYSSSISVVSG
jgi:hypothetical protein